MTDLTFAAPLRRLTQSRPTIGQTALNLTVTLYLLAVLNTGFRHRLIEIFGDRPLSVALFLAAIAGLTLFTLELLGPGRLQRPVAAVLILIASGATYFEQAYGVLIDREMVRNVFETTAAESRHLVTLGAVRSVALTGVLPASLLFWPRVRRVQRWHLLWRWPLGIALSLALVVGGLFADYKTFSAVLRERQDLMSSYQPGATLTAVVRYARQQWMASALTFRPIATDAAPGARLAAADRPILLVLFVGETLRAQNFGLNGYARQTTPGLAAREVINFPDVSACGTSTAVSLPCMFSLQTQATYARDRFLAQENLLDVLVRAGFVVRWIDNNTGDQQIAARTGWDRVDPALDPAACAVECTDAVFLPLIEQTLANLERNTVLVLHMIGSHGPAYHLRYPPERAAFTPDCQSREFARCTVDEIVNAYDNTALQTDHVLSRTIDLLSGSTQALTAMLFLSDHGESLGEGGLYLHAAPMFMAPETQTRVPMVLWTDTDFRDAMDLDESCLRAAAARPTSHDALFHILLGLLDVRTQTRNPALDLVADCHGAGEGS